MINLTRTADRLTRGERGGNVRGMFDQAKAEQLCDAVASGDMVLAEACREPGMPRWQTVHDWQKQNPAFAGRLAHARDTGYDRIAANVRRVARGDPKYSTGDVQRDKLIVETDLKLLGKWDSKRYGDKIQVDQDLRMQVEIIDCTRAITAEAVLQSQQPLPALASTSIQSTDSET